MATKPDGTVPVPQGAVVPGSSTPPAAKAPGDAKPSGTPSGSPYKVGPSESVLGETVAPEDVFNGEDEAFVGVDPQYQNYANDTEKPLEGEEE